jgi:hypothetical protein
MGATFVYNTGEDKTTKKYLELEKLLDKKLQQ